MKDGYYLATYLHIDEISHLYAFHVRHDQNVSLWNKTGTEVNLIHYWELERISGLKRHRLSFFNRNQAVNMLNTLLSQYSLQLEDMQAIIGTPLLDTVEDYHSLKEYPLQSYHSIAHLFSALLMDTNIFYNNDIIGMAVDGGPDAVVDIKVNEKNYYSGCFSAKGKIKVFDIISPGFIWAYARKKFNLREGTLMALATASSSELSEDFSESIIEARKTKDLRTAHRYVQKLYNYIDNITQRDSGILFNGFDERFSESDNKISMAVKEIQKMSLRIMDYNIQNVIDSYGVDPKKCYIALAGGYILNCPTNSYIMQKYKFKGFLAPPCVNDAGMSLGIALYYFYKNMERVDFKLKTAFHGDSLDDINSIFSQQKFGNYIEQTSDIKVEHFIADIEKAPVVWFYGKAEIGPRALGHRSILADPRSSTAKDILNKVKKRQWWRPVAPIVLTDYVEDWFVKPYSSPFMLHTIEVKENKAKHVSAICHLDNTARLQTIEQETDPILYDIIQNFYEKTGIPMICNTSLNDAGEPIINTAEECLNFALRKRFSVVYINGKRIVLKNHDNYPLKAPLPREMNFEPFSEEQKNDLKKKYNPFDLSAETLIFRYFRPEITKNFNINEFSEAEKLKKYAKISKQVLGDIPTPGL